MTTTNTSEAGDCEDLEALFDSIVCAGAPVAAETAPTIEPAAADATDADRAQHVISKIGKMTRGLHESLRELGYGKLLEDAATQMPDTRDRLAYVATMTEKAAERTLNAAEAAQPIQATLETNAAALSLLWKQLFDKQLSVDEFKDLAGKTKAYLDDIPNHTRATNAYLMEIMMAQDFQDLTGQVIKKITEVAQSLEQQLLGVLVENAPADKKAELGGGLMNGPVIKAAGRNDIVSNQNQVDDLLESLGF
jgi:chemotaxis protein CheZ